MKTLLLSLALMAIAFGAPAAATLPSPVAGEYWISATPPPILPAAWAIEFPTGFIENPYDGSTVSNFDAVMRSIPPYSLIHLKPGVYQTMGDTTAGGMGWGPKPGWVIEGAGMYLTTLQFPSNAVVSGALNRGHLIKAIAQPWPTNVTVMDLTLDCNYQPVLDVAPNLDLALKTSSLDGAFTLDGITLIGPGNAIRRVRCINTAAVTTSATNYAEAWGIFCAPLPGLNDAVENEIEDCIVSDSHSNFKNDLVALGLMYGSGIIRHNFITQSGTNAMIGIMVGTHDVVMDGNILTGVICGSHYDSGQGITNVTIVNNDFNGCNEAIDWENGVVQDVTIANNNIVLTNTTGNTNATVEAFFFHPSPSAFYNVAIKDNSVRVAGTNAFPYQRFMFTYNAQGLTVTGNRVDPALANYFDATCSGVVMKDNYDLAGNPCPFVLPVPVAPAPPQFTVTVNYPTNAPILQVVYPTAAPVVTIKQN